MTVRMLIEAYTVASRRTAKRAIVKRLWATGSWMFEERDFNGKWE